MIKRILKYIVPLSLLVSFITLQGFSNDHDYKFHLDANKNTIDQLVSNNNPLVEKNGKKFTKKYKKSKLELNLNYLYKEKKEFDGYTVIPINAKGVINSPDKAFPFNGTGHVYLYEFDEKKLHNGYIKLEFNNKKYENESVHEDLLSFRYDENTGNIDASVASGAIGSVAFIPFGKPFLYDDDYEKIEKLKTK